MVYARPDRQLIVALELDPGTTAREAALESGLDAYFDDLDLAQVPLGIFGEKVADDAVLAAGDRVELYRPLLQDPMQRRRQRAAADRVDGKSAQR